MSIHKNSLIDHTCVVTIDDDYNFNIVDDQDTPCFDREEAFLAKPSRQEKAPRMDRLQSRIGDLSIDQGPWVSYQEPVIADDQPWEETDKRFVWFRENSLEKSFHVPKWFEELMDKLISVRNQYNKITPSRWRTSQPVLGKMVKKFFEDTKVPLLQVHVYKAFFILGLILIAPKHFRGIRTMVYTLCRTCGVSFAEPTVPVEMTTRTSSRSFNPADHRGTSVCHIFTHSVYLKTLN